MKISIKKKAISVLCASFVLITNNAYAEMKTENNYVEAKTNVNIRYGETTKSNKIGLFKNEDSAYRILSIDDWDLIKYNDMIGFVCNEYTKKTSNDNNEKCNYTEVNDILYATADVNFRLGPSKKDKKIGLVKKDSELFPIAKTDNNWYIVKYNGKIGYVSGDYVKSLKEEMKNQYDIEDFSVKRIVYAKEKDFIYNDKNEIIGCMEQYEDAYLIDKIDEYSLVKTDNCIGYILNSSLKENEGKLIEIDLKDQRITLYCENDVLITSKIVSGKPSTPTNIGSFKIKTKETNRYLKGEDYNTYVNFWMPFDGGIGLHDATWRKKFGDEIYLKKGSHGCINLPYEIAEYIYNNVNVGTKVLVHK